MSHQHSLCRVGFTLNAVLRCNVNYESNVIPIYYKFLSQAHVYSEGNNVYDVMLNQVNIYFIFIDHNDEFRKIIQFNLIPILLDFIDKSSI